MGRDFETRRRSGRPADVFPANTSPAYLLRLFIQRSSSSRWKRTTLPGPDARREPALTARQIVVRSMLQYAAARV